MAAERGIDRDLLQRWEGNPIISVEHMPFRANTVFNGTPIPNEDGVYMLLRVEGRRGYSFFALARSDDGLHFVVDDKPVMLPATDGPFAVYEEAGIEDPRVTFVEGTCYVLYTVAGNCGPRIALAKTEDYVHYERIALVSEPGNKDGVLFPRKVGGRYVRLDRPIGLGRGSIWVSYSPDLVNWGDSQVIVPPRGGYWDSYRVGASVPPIETPEGWLEIYHGTKMTSAGPIYRIGTVLLDLDNPSRVIKRCLEPILSPREYYERIGDVGNVCFACGAVISGDGQVKIYYGAADTSICVATCTMDDLVRESFK
ncbi:MAG: glycoside hydrolase family 130 protein [Planctomycetes bacterium]|nr:glycoside hydrolase family 130 protein [Planctomycetota bacterium]